MMRASMAAIALQRYGTSHHALVTNQGDYGRQFQRTVWHLEEPIDHPHTMQILRLYDLAKDFITGVLTGGGIRRKRSVTQRAGDL